MSARRLAAAAALLVAALGLAGCVVEPAPGVAYYPGTHWVPGHYDRFGYWHPGHWAPG